MEDLPADLTIDILSRLPLKTIFYCQRVCKKWRNLVSDSSFVNLHFSRSPTVVIIHHHPHLGRNRGWYDLKDPGILKWVEIKDQVDLHYEMSLDLNRAPIIQNRRIQPMGSVNGLLCLWQQGLDCDDTYICNPVTREIMFLPSPPSYRQCSNVAAYGFGVNSLTGEYKLVRAFQRRCTSERITEAEIYTLGTGQWRSLGRVPYRLQLMDMPDGPFLNDHCHWMLSIFEDAPERICTFDFSKETFQLFPSPPPADNREALRENCIFFESLAVLKGCLCQSEAYDSQFTIWMMKEYGIKNSWHKVVSIIQDINREFTEPVSVIEKDGSILVVDTGILWAIRKTVEVTKIFEFCVSGVACRPNFLKLQSFELERVHTF